ncbi:MAG: Mur ligase domain-containing protein [Dehalococcoidales bacterium]|nr:Mur ligase domain-containing protein [Dehalococcoidales bacterium]
MRLSELLSDIPVHGTTDNVGIEVGGIAVDSRQVRPGDEGVALVGRDADGHRFIPQALTNGAAAVVVERELPGLAVTRA